MNCKIITMNYIEGFHYWNNAPEKVAFLRNNHRHLFHVECYHKVSNLDREIEIFMEQDRIKQWFDDIFGSPAIFNGRSCEMIAEMILQEFPNMDKCIVREDGLGGAVMERNNI